MTSYPCYLVRKGSFDADTVNRMAKIIAPNPVRRRDGKTCYEDIEEQLKSQLRGVPQEQDDGTVIYIQWDESGENIAMLSEQLKATPNHEEWFETDTIDVSMLPCDWIYELADGARVGIYCDNEARHLGITRFPTAGVEFANADGIIEALYPREGIITYSPKITPREAREICDTFLEKAGIEGFSASSCKVARMNDVWYEDVAVGYWFEYCHVFAYAAESMDGGGNIFRFEEDFAYSMPWYAERIHIFADENGIQFVNWQEPLEILRVDNTESELLSFEEIKNNALKLMSYGMAWRENQRGTVQYVMDKVTLTLALQRVYGKSDEALLVPAWVFRYMDAYAFRHGKGVAYECFVLNAVSGRRMELFTSDGG